MEEKSLVPAPNLSIALDPEVKKSLVSWEDHISYFLQLEEVSSAFSWAKSDLLLSLTDKFGEKSLEQFSTEVNIPRGTVINYTRVAKAFPVEKRISGLSFTGHFQASLADSYNTEKAEFDGEKRFEWAEKAHDEKMSVRELATQIHSDKKKRDLEVEELPCTKCGQGSDTGEVKQFVIYSPRSKKDATILEMHESCFQEVLKYAQTAQLVTQ